MAGYAVMTIEAIPSIDDEGVDWKPIQHYFQLTAFGMNVYRATAPGVQVIGEHDELVGVFHGQEAQQHLIGERKNRCVRTDAERECHNDDGRKRRSVAKCAEGMAQVHMSSLDGNSARRVVRSRLVL